ncbi:DNA alkylation repair protein [Paenibacillus xylaniclasticus]|uniref:DNA alkylation repair protein n=1 Tax=Paenibacillus xylaniclasticus TaxID=588083 RepID=UPI000FD85DFA|nr:MULTISPECIES: DNA alkylation repair protein [Paenibacillus]GFN31563.1 hypothetical protein PCURB6_18230 [Paenibacillus curdlanolyticus]
MAEPLKNIYDGNFIYHFSALVREAWPPFQAERFTQLVIGEGWEQLELKGRMRRITLSLGQTLPSRFEEAVEVLCAIDEQCIGLAYLFFPDFIEVFGRDEAHWELSMSMLQRFTSRSTSEFAIRPFILEQPERTLKAMLAWADSEDEHIRRLASEGCRPLLPWAPALPMLRRDPSPALPILEKLRCDESLYVRKSVANHLNDISKVHPDVVVRTAKRWFGTHPLTDWIVRKGCRTLVKQAEPTIMSLFGYGENGEQTDNGSNGLAAKIHQFEPIRSEVTIGEETLLYYDVQLPCEGAGSRVRLEYSIDFVRPAGKLSHKRFLLADKPILPDALRLKGTKRHAWRELSTRKLFSGEHRIALWINGKEAAETFISLHAAEGEEQR